PMLASRKFGKTEKPSLPGFKFNFESERNVKNWFMIFVQALSYVALIGLELITIFLVQIVSLAIIIIYPLIALIDKIFKTGLRELAAGFSNLAEGKFARKKTLWDNYFTNTPFTAFITSMKNRTPWITGSIRNFSDAVSGRPNLLKKILIIVPALLKLLFWDLTISYLYYLIRFLVNSTLALFSRLLFTFVAAFIILGKALFIVLLTFLAPVLKVVNLIFGKFISFVNDNYPKLLNISLKNDTKIIASVLIVFLITILVILPNIGKELIPEVHQGTIFVNITLPVGTPVEKSDRILQRISSQISKIALTKGISYFAGTTKDELSEKEVGEHIGKITVNIVKSGNIQIVEEHVISNIRTVLKEFSDVNYNISRPALFTIKSPIELIIKGFNLEELRRVSSELYQKISEINGLKDVESSVKSGFPELVVEFERAKLAHFGMNAFDVASIIKNKIEGFVATKYKERDRRIDVRVYLKDDQRTRAENIKNLIINPGDKIPIFLSSVA
ncbi:MAG: efflux RND transporter permease subunit, partial [Candidatus Aminicenantes bacterium]|nr:efflux RND transporter permease subunit [Candidatus Aminicenantes bacterium]